MITIKSNEEAEKLIKNGVLKIDDDLEIAFDGFSIEADIKCNNIYSKDYRRNINAWNINAWDINAWDINAWDINAWNINARNIDARNIDARNINALDIDARNIDAWNINARDIKYYAICFAYNNIKCKSIEGTRDKCKYFVLDGEIIIKDEKNVCECCGQKLRSEE